MAARPGELIETDKEVDPDLQVTGLQKHMDGGCPVLFNNVKGKPNHRVDHQSVRRHGDHQPDVRLEGRRRAGAQARLRAVASDQAGGDRAERGAVPGARIENPRDVNEWMVPIRHTTYEPELTVGSGIRCVTGAQFDGGSDLGYNRMNFRWGNVGTFQISPGSHMWQVVNKYYKEDQPVPITMCFGVPPACTLLGRRRLRLRDAADGLRRDRHRLGGAGRADPPRQSAHRGRHGARRLRNRAGRLRQSARPPLRDQGSGGCRRTGPLSLPPGVGRLYGQVLQGADLPRHRHHHAQAGDQADHLRARRAHARRSQYRHHRARGRDLRTVQSAAAGHRAERGDPVLHDRLGRLHHPGEEAPPDRRGLAAQFHGRGFCRARRACGSRSR